MLASDWDTCVAMARDQEKEGAHVIDVCVDYTGEDGVVDMDEVVSRFATQATVPLMLDSTEAPVIEAGLQRIAGKPLLNSVNLEDGSAPGTRFDRFLSLAREYGAAVVCTCIDEEGQARTAEWKLRAAQSIYDLAVGRYGMDPSDLLFDPLVLPISTGMEESRRDGIETIEGIRADQGVAARGGDDRGPVQHLLRAEPAGPPRPQLGVPARVPAGRAGRRHRARGADHAAQQDRPPGRRGVPRPDLRPSICRATTRCRSCWRCSRAFPPAAVVKEDRSGWPVEKRLAQRIIDGDRDGLDADLDQALAAGVAALSIVNDTLLGGMKVVGDLFGSGQMQLPFVLQSAETMKASVAHLEPHMERSSRGRQGPHRAGHGQGRRPRHRQEPGRHHLHQQRLRGAQPRDQGAHQRHAGEGRRGAVPTPSA